MVSGLVRELQRTDPRKVKIVYERGPRWYSVWVDNPRIAQLGQVGDFHEWCPRVDRMRPYTARKTKEQWDWKAYRPPVGELYFRKDELAFAAQHPPRVVIEIDVKFGASPNKQWGSDNWYKLAKMLKGADIEVCQIGQLPPLMMPHATFVKTETIRHAAALIANARAVVCHEGALHHIAAAVGTPAVVLYGGYISPNVTGYDGQVGLFTGEGLGCGMRVPCAHCRAAMAAIKPGEVFERLMGVIRG